MSSTAGWEALRVDALRELKTKREKELRLRLQDSPPHLALMTNEGQDLVRLANGNINALVRARDDLLAVLDELGPEGGT